MSCQQASRYITTKNNSNISNSNCKNLNNSQNHIIIKGNRSTSGVIQQEDPYVFTESVPTTPPILFSTQKTRTRLNDLTSATNIGKLQQQKLPLTETNGKITSISNQIKTQASFISSATTATTINTSTAPTSQNNLTHSIIATSALTNNNCNNKKITNVCVVRPQLQTQQSHYYHYQQQQQHNQNNYINSLNEYEGDLKSISPPPLYTPPTPSLWQTPLLLESTASTAGNTSPKVGKVAIRKASTTTSQIIPIMGTTVGSSTTTVGAALPTTAMAKVAPIIVHAPLAPPPHPPAHSPNQCLPPSKFHNHTLAQHLQKVECLKKSKKLTEIEANLCNDNVNCFSAPLKSSSPLALSTATSLADNAESPVKHSENEDLNEIPVNVIFRRAVVSQAHEKSPSNIQFVKPQIEIDSQTQPQSSPPQPTPSAPPSPPTTTRINTKVNNKKLSTSPASIKLQQINTSSILPQQQNNATKPTATTTTTALNSHQMPIAGDDNNSHATSTNSEASTKIIANNCKTIVVNTTKGKNSTHSSNKIRKLNLFPTANLSFDLPYKWQMGCSTTKGAVAVVKMSQHNIDLDTTHLATTTGLPYCLQQYWLNSYDFCKYNSEMPMNSNPPINRSLAREERIALHKQQLYRKAVQLLSIRTLQKLPFQLARRRLLCVDRLLSKYEQNEENKKTLPANKKSCCINGCDNYTLEMASHCQQHIVYNTAQHVFLPCTAKFADNTQCRVPVFDITHDMPLCMEHARKRDAYNRHLYEQRPRKISTNPITTTSESIILMSKMSASNTNAGGRLVAGGVAIKNQNYQHKQHQQQQRQHILQQLPLNNNNNGNKQQNLVNQQPRKRKMTNVGLTVNPVGRPQKRVKKTIDKSVDTPTAPTVVNYQMPRLTLSSLKRKSSTTSLESIASNSQHSTTSSTSQHPQQYQRQQPQQHLYSVTPTISNAKTASLAPPALAPLSSGLVGHGLPQHLFSFSHDNHHHPQQPPNQAQNHHRQQQQIHTININEKQHSFSASTNNTTGKASTPTELKELISQFALISQKHTTAEKTITAADVNLLNTNSNSNFTSSGMGSTTSLPTADDFLTQDMLSICENSSASSVDTGLGGLSDSELMLGGPEDDIPLDDTHLLEEHDLENVLNSLPEDAFKELFTTVHQDESDEIERAIELADKHLKTLQQTIGSELGNFLDFSDEMLMDNGGGICNGSMPNTVLDTSALFIEDGNVAAVGANTTQGGGGAVVIGTDIRGLVQT